MSTRNFSFGLLAAIVVAGALLLGAGQDSASSTTFQTYELPSFRIFRLGSEIGRLDTRTGAVSILQGPATARGSSNSWARRVRAVQGQTSGMLDVQILQEGSPDGVFLVDVVGNRTWLLSYRGNQNGEWRTIAESARN
jgi:hypothetical protein